MTRTMIRRREVPGTADTMHFPLLQHELEGELWTLRGLGAVVRLKDSRGNTWIPDNVRFHSPEIIISARTHKMMIAMFAPCAAHWIESNRGSAGSSI